MTVTKTYTREVRRFFTREELADLLKKAHEECKKEVPLTVHQIGTKRKRTVLMRRADAYRSCIKKKIVEALKSKLGPEVKIEVAY